VQGFLKAVNRAIGDVLANPEAGMDAVMKREPLLNRALERDRLQATLKAEMSHPEIASIGLGDVATDRLKRSIAMVVQANGLPRTPAPEEIFDRSFLPARGARPGKR
jgi:NitT/TauT family transport system substrate-binding protein